MLNIMDMCILEMQTDKRPSFHSQLSRCRRLPELHGLMALLLQSITGNRWKETFRWWLRNFPVLSSRSRFQDSTLLSLPLGLIHSPLKWNDFRRLGISPVVVKSPWLTSGESVPPVIICFSSLRNSPEDTEGIHLNIIPSKITRVWQLKTALLARNVYKCNWCNR